MKDFWTYRELVRNLTVVDLKNRYQNTALGFLWSLLSPFLLALVLYFVFRYLFGQGPEFPRYLLVGLMTWRFFATGTMSSLYSIVGKPSLVTKIFVPRKILVFSSLCANLISSLLEFIVTVPILFVLSGSLPITLLLFPLIFLVYFCFVYGASLLLSALYVYFRDLNQIWEVLVNILFFLSPVIYPMIQISDKTMPYYLLNPLTEFIIIYRNLMVYGTLPSLYSLAIIIFAGVGSIIIGNLIFDRLQRRFAEAI
jgi:lipopolysaccharide transport system permease protein